MGKKNTGKSHSMSIRLEEELNSQLDYFSTELDTSKSDIITKSLKTWMAVQHEGQFQDVLIISKTIARFLFETASEDKMIVFSEDHAKMFNDITKMKLNEKAKEFSINNYLEILKDELSSELLAWFEKLAYQFLEDNKISIIGIHNMNRGFSIFIRYMFENALKFSFNYTIIKESIRITENSVSMEFLPKP